jgi:hypothetical protein
VAHKACRVWRIEGVAVITDDQREKILKACMGAKSIERIAADFQVSPDIVKQVFKDHIDAGSGGRIKGVQTDSRR